jgi:hypothetical protein
MKVCTKCKVEKSLDCYGKQKGGLYGLRSVCFECRRIEGKIYASLNKERRSDYVKNYTNTNKDKISFYGKKYRQENKEKIKKYRQENKEKIKETQSNYYKKNKELVLKKNSNYRDKRLKNDPIFKFIHHIRSNIKNTFKRGNNQFRKGARTETILGCTIEEFRLHIEKQFTEGMSFENHGEWHLDHIKPISLATTEEEVIALNHYTNFQPLWAEDNLRKGNKYEEIR